MTRVTSIGLDELRVGPTAALFEGGLRAGAGITMFVVRTPPGSFVELHAHPYAETFVLLAGSGRWTAGEQVLEVRAERIISVPAETPHGFRNTGECRCWWCQCMNHPLSSRLSSKRSLPSGTLDKRSEPKQAMRLPQTSTLLVLSDAKDASGRARSNFLKLRSKSAAKSSARIVKSGADGYTESVHQGAGAPFRVSFSSMNAPRPLVWSGSGARGLSYSVRRR
jgi:quercetin dioxygenase-like cupin family protein